MKIRNSANREVSSPSAYLGLLFSVLQPLQAVLFVAVHRGLYGLYMVSIFAPNHKAMPMLEKDSQVGFLRRQVLTSRNVFAHPITDFWYGGLNYQIEHHLFPRLPRNKLREAQPLVKAFCRDHSIGYHPLLQPLRKPAFAYRMTYVLRWFLRAPGPESYTFRTGSLHPSIQLV